LKIEIVISKIDEAINCVEFVKVDGPILEYYEIIKRIKEHLSKLK